MKSRKLFITMFAIQAIGCLLLPGIALSGDNPEVARVPRVLARGHVFEDRNKNGVMDAGELGISNVMVSNGRDVVRTNHLGRYRLPAYEGMTVFVTKPAGYEVPVDEHNVPQFFYHHLPAGSPPLRFGGLPPTGALPRRINFPLIKGEDEDQFKMIIVGDTQPYSNAEIGYVRDTLVKALAAMDMEDVKGLILEGDIVGGRTLDLYPRFKEIMSVAGVPQYAVPGNHDMDHEATSDAHSLDTFKREWGPTYYSFDIGKVHFVVLDNIQYPCTNDSGHHGFCDISKNYNGVISEQQLQWLENDLRHVPMDKLIVVNTHISMVSFVDRHSNMHQTDNAGELYRLLEGRPALALSGHTHTLEHFEPGEGARPDVRGVDIPATPFPQIIAGAVSGSWWNGDFDDDSVPISYQRQGEKRGFMVFEFDGNTYKDTYVATGTASDRQITVSLLSPTFTNWYQQLRDWMRTRPANTDNPPVNINDLDDTHIVPTAEINQTSLIANVWNGSSATTVTVQFNDGVPIPMMRSEDTIDPFALRKQMYVFRYAAESNSGNPRAQGFEVFGGWPGGVGRGGPSSPRPLPEWLHTDESSHLWKVALPTELGNGVHTAKVVALDKFGRKYEEMIVFERRETRPEKFTTFPDPIPFP